MLGFDRFSLIVFRFCVWLCFSFLVGKVGVCSILVISVSVLLSWLMGIVIVMWLVCVLVLIFRLLFRFLVVMVSVVVLCVGWLGSWLFLFIKVKVSEVRLVLFGGLSRLFVLMSSIVVISGSVWCLVVVRCRLLGSVVLVMVGIVRGWVGVGCGGWLKLCGGVVLVGVFMWLFLKFCFWMVVVWWNYFCIVW